MVRQCTSEQTRPVPPPPFIEGAGLPVKAINERFALVYEAFGGVYDELDCQCDNILELLGRIEAIEAEFNRPGIPSPACRRVIKMEEPDDVMAWLKDCNSFCTPDSPVKYCEIKVDKPVAPLPWEIDKLETSTPWAPMAMPQTLNNLHAAIPPTHGFGKWIFILFDDPCLSTKNEVPS